MCACGGLFAPYRQAPMCPPNIVLVVPFVCVTLSSMAAVLALPAVHYHSSGTLGLHQQIKDVGRVNRLFHRRVLHACFFAKGEQLVASKHAGPLCLPSSPIKTLPLPITQCTAHHMHAWQATLTYSQLLSHPVVMCCKLRRAHAALRHAPCCTQVVWCRACAHTFVGGLRLVSNSRPRGCQHQCCWAGCKPHCSFLGRGWSLWR